MSAAADRPDSPSFEPTDPPTFALKFLVDDEVEPTELTIFSPNEDDITTHWITVDFDDAIPLEAVR
jgi:hypothetical protein